VMGRPLPEAAAGGGWHNAAAAHPRRAAPAQRVAGGLLPRAVRRLARSAAYAGHTRNGGGSLGSAHQAYPVDSGAQSDLFGAARRHLTCA
jgi:hypothetical protein